MATRFLAAISGLTLVHLLPVKEYGFYTLVLAAFSFICTFSDLGVTETLSFFRWRSATKNKTWVPYLYAIMRFRRTVFVIGLFVIAIYIYSTGQHIGEETPAIITGIIATGIAAWFAIKASVIAYALKLEQHFRQAYAVELSNEGIKLLVVGLIWIFGLATALSGMVSVAIGALVASLLASSFAAQYAYSGQKPTARNTTQRTRVLLGQVMPILPGTIYFTLQGPLIAWLAAYFGSVVNVAEVGALGRIGIIIGVISGFTGSVFVPRLIAISDQALFLKRYLQWWLVIIIFGGMVMLPILALPDALLYLLGDSYSGLQTELITTAGASVIATWGAFSWHINRARGWVKYQPYRVPFIIAGQIPMLVLLDFSSTQVVLLFSLGSIILDVLFQTAISALGFCSRNKKVGKINHV